MEAYITQKTYLTRHPVTMLTTILKKCIAGKAPSKKTIMEQEENDRMTLKLQESIECGVPVDGGLEVSAENRRGHRKKTSKTIFSDNLGNLLKICLAFGIMCVMVLLVVVVVLTSKKVCLKGDGRIPGLLCTQCSAFLPSSDLTPYKDVGPVRVYNARATGSYCCVETADQLERLKQLLSSKPNQANQRSIFDRKTTYYSIGKPTAHLFLNVSKSAKRGNFLPWSVPVGSSTAFVAGGVTYSVQDGKLKIPTSGHYYVYSHVTFRLKEPDLSKKTVSLYRHYILRFNPYLPNGGEQEVISDTQTKLPLKKNRPYVLQSSYIGAILELRKGDQLMVGVSEIASVFRVAEENFFGLYKL